MTQQRSLTYIQPGDREAWVDWPAPRATPPAFIPGYTKKCTVCRGHGGWNLLLGAYPVPRDNTSENRHMYTHMKASCHACGGHGWVRPEVNGCVHEFRWIGVSGKVTHFNCVHCREAVSWDTHTHR